jgi:hypothetical protein
MRVVGDEKRLNHRSRWLDPDFVVRTSKAV